MTKRIKTTKEDIIKASELHHTATGAAASLGLRYDTYRKYAIEYGVFKTNQSRKGYKRPKSEYANKIIALEDILDGKHPQYQRRGIKLKLFEAGLKENKCEVCSIEEWNGAPINMHLDHIDGNTYNHKLDNLRMICPNCHSQTETYCGRNKGK